MINTPLEFNYANLDTYLDEAPFEDQYFSEKPFPVEARMKIPRSISKGNFISIKNKD